MVDLDANFRSDRRCHGERCYVTLVDNQEDAALAAARRRKMDENFPLGDAGAAKNVSNCFEQQITQ